MSNNTDLEFTCPVCRGGIKLNQDSFTCPSGHAFFRREEIIDFTPPDLSLPSIYNDPEYLKWCDISYKLLLDSYKSGSWLERIQDSGHLFLESLAEKNSDNWKLDLGCGFGRHFDFVSNKKKLIGFDSNQDSLKVAIKDNPGSVFIKGRMERLPFPDSFFSVIYAVYSLEHVYNLDSVIKEIRRVLTRTGQVLVGLPAEGGFLYNGMRKMTTIPYFTKKYGIDYEKVVKIEHCNTARKVLAALSAEFRRERIKYYPFVLRSMDMNLIVLASFRNG